MTLNQEEKDYLHWLSKKIDSVEKIFRSSKKEHLKSYWEGFLDALILCQSKLLEKIQHLIDKI